MDYAIYIGDLNTVVYRKDVGIVLDEATCVAYQKGLRGGFEALAIGDIAKKMHDKATNRDTIVSMPVRNGRIIDVEGAKVFFQGLLGKVENNKKPSVLVLISSSLSKKEFSDWKKMVYSSAVADAEFVPYVITSAIGLGYDVDGLEAGLSVHIGDNGTDIAVISLAGIIRGGTIKEGLAECIGRIQAYVLKQFSLRISEQMARQILSEVGTLKRGDEVSFLMNGVDNVTGNMREVLISGVDCQTVLEVVYSKIVRAVRQVLIDCPPDIISEICCCNVYFGGVGCDISGLREFMTEGLELEVKINGCLESAITGAAKLLDDCLLLKKIVQAN